MDNLERKKEYLTVGADIPVASKLLCEYILKYEKEFGKDAGDFTYEEAIEALKGINTVAYPALQKKLRILRQYTDWYISTGQSALGINNYKKIDSNNLRKCLNTEEKDCFFIREDELREIVYQRKNPIDRYLLVGLFEGIRGEDYCEILNLKLSDIDINTQIVSLCTGRNIPVSPLFIECAIEASEAKGLTIDTDPPRYYMFMETENLYKTLLTSGNKVPDRVTINRKLSVIKEETKHPGIATVRLQYSGLCFYIEQLAARKRVHWKKILKTPECKRLYAKYNLINKDSLYITKRLKEYLGD